MGFVCETARLDGTGLGVDVFDKRSAEALAAAPSLAAAGFCTALDRAPALPEPSAAARIVVLGIGGSALGARAVREACAGDATRPLEVVDNIDPEAFERAWRGGDPRETDWVVVSKSGGTTETLAQCAVLRERLRPLRRWQDVCVVTGLRGPLREWAGRDRLRVFEVPEEVGGRFSVFTPAATAPLALAGLDVHALLEGARAARAHAGRTESVAARLAAFLVGALDAGKGVVTLWSYAERLETVGEWFRQLWAESLGKRRGDERVGQTPLHCVGSTDQHSIQQLLVEGPNDKVALIVSGPPSGALEAPADTPGAGAGHAFAAILDAMRRATTAEMVRAGTPAMTLRLDDWGERSMGALLMTFLCATVLAGELLGVDPYGQPGVEAAKIATRQLLADPRGSADRAIAELLGEGGGTDCP